MCVAITHEEICGVPMPRKVIALRLLAARRKLRHDIARGLH
jgi:hypothetical protein